MACFPAPAPAQNVKPDQAWRVVDGTHFRVTFAPGLDSLAVRAAVAAESVRTVLSRELGSPPAGKIDLVLSDDTDDSNGYATEFPSNRVVIFAHPPADNVLLGDFNEWVHGLLAHELTHIWQIDRAGWAGRVLRVPFGRLPFWPFFPAVGAPNWFIEGNAVSFETGLTGRGRLAGRIHEMMLRTAMLEGHAEPYDRISNPTSSWPGSNRHYAFGSLYVDHLERRYGPGVRARLTANCAGAVIPPPLAFDRVAQQAIRRSFSASYRDWQRGLRLRYALLRDSLVTEGLTATEALAEGGAWSGPMRFAPDGQSLVYHRSDWLRPDMAVELDLGSGRERDIVRHGVSANYAWLPTGEILTSRVEVRDAYRLCSDLWRIQPDGHEEQVTHGARLADPDFCLNSGATVAVENGRGTTRLVLVNLARGRVSYRLPSSPEIAWAHPRWSPDGSRIAVERLSAGNRDIVILDPAGNVQAEITRDRASDAYPAWSPDGRLVIFASDRTGIWNLFAAAPQGPLRQVTNLIGGALQSDVSPDGKWIVFSSYHADGMRIEQIPCDPETWRSPPVATSSGGTAAGFEISPTLPAAPAPIGDPGRTAAPSPRRRSSFAIRPYHPWRSMRPHYWMPYYFGGTETGDYYGLVSSGADLVGRHAWSAWAVMDPESRRLQGAAGYTWAGLGNPVLGLGAGQSWDLLRASYRDGLRRNTRERTQSFAVTATLSRRRVLRNAALSAGGEIIERRREPAGAYADSLGAPVALRHPLAQLYGITGTAAYSSASGRPYSVSLDGGNSIRVDVRRRWGQAQQTQHDPGETETRVSVAAYRSAGRIAWSRPVLLLRGNGLVRNGGGASWADLGGVSEGTLDLEFAMLGGSRLLPLRGFPAGVRSGTRAWSAGIEGRLPLCLVERGFVRLPLFLERTWTVAFLDAGDAWTPLSQGGRPGGCGGGPCLDGYALDPLVSAGMELALRGTIAQWVPLTLRFGLARQLAGGSATTTYVALGG